MSADADHERYEAIQRCAIARATAGAEGAGLLQVLLDNGHIPSLHRESAVRILHAYDHSYDEYDAMVQK